MLLFIITRWHTRRLKLLKTHTHTHCQCKVFGVQEIPSHSYFLFLVFPPIAIRILWIELFDFVYLGPASQIKKDKSVRLRLLKHLTPPYQTAAPNNQNRPTLLSPYIFWVIGLSEVSARAPRWYFRYLVTNCQASDDCLGFLKNLKQL